MSCDDKRETCSKSNNTQEKSKCRICGKVDETVNDIVSECNMLAQIEYK